jgi:cation diffusion facilitator CzcD-associated flavoprotein CzcO
MCPQLPEGFDIDKHFTPRYRPWQQRIAMVPDGDLFAAPWTHMMEHEQEREILPQADLDDGTLAYR